MHENDIFFTSVKYTLVSCTPWVSWAALHTAVCLDIIGQFKQVYILWEIK